MSFKEGTRRYYLEVADNKCQYEYYREDKGFVECGKPARHVHHIVGEAETLLKGGDPERNTGLPLCESHHVRNTSEEAEWQEDFSFHPDVGRAYHLYSDWKQAEKHLNSIAGKSTMDYSTSPFADVSREHRKMAEEGERYIAGDEVIDQYYEDKMKRKAVVYNARNGITKPITKQHPLTDRNKRTDWKHEVLELFSDGNVYDSYRLYAQAYLGYGK